MRWKDITWKAHDTIAGVQNARVVIGEFVLSIITETDPYGVQIDDLYECAILSHEGRLLTLTGINHSTEEWDDEVLRYQTQEEVVGLIRKLETIDGTPPTNYN